MHEYTLMNFSNAENEYFVVSQSQIFNNCHLQHKTNFSNKTRQASKAQYTNLGFYHHAMRLHLLNPPEKGQSGGGASEELWLARTEVYVFYVCLIFW